MPIVHVTHTWTHALNSSTSYTMHIYFTFVHTHLIHVHMCAHIPRDMHTQANSIHSIHICTCPTCVHIHTCTHLTAIHTAHTHTHGFPNHLSELYEVPFNIYCILPGFVIWLVLPCLLLPLSSLCCLLTQPLSCTPTSSSLLSTVR